MAELANKIFRLCIIAAVDRFRGWVFGWVEQSYLDGHPLRPENVLIQLSVNEENPSSSSGVVFVVFVIVVIFYVRLDIDLLHGQTGRKRQQRKSRTDNRAVCHSGKKTIFFLWWWWVTFIKRIIRRRKLTTVITYLYIFFFIWHSVCNLNFPMRVLWMTWFLDFFAAARCWWSVSGQTNKFLLRLFAYKIVPCTYM